jgi:hypothetical protein
MWEYSGRRDLTRFSSDELKEIEIDNAVCTVSVLTKKTDVPKEFGTEPLDKAHPRTEVHDVLEHLHVCPNWFLFLLLPLSEISLLKNSLSFEQFLDVARCFSP